MSSSEPPLIPFGPDSTCTLALCPITDSVYRYRPSLPANSVFIALYSLLLVAHLYLGHRWKGARWFMWCMVAGCLDEIVGYAGRVMMWHNPFNFAAFMIQIVCVTTAPVFFCAGIYVTLARTINAFNPTLSRIQPSLFYKIFIPADIVSLILQGVGGGMSSSSSGRSQTAIDLALAGLGFQVFTLVVFSALFIDYLARFARTPAAKSVLDARMKTFLGFLGLAIVLILARCAFRVDELSEGYGGPLVAREGLFIGLEGVLIVLATLALCVGHPGFAFGRVERDKDILSSAESATIVVTEKK